MKRLKSGSWNVIIATRLALFIFMDDADSELQAGKWANAEVFEWELWKSYLTVRQYHLTVVWEVNEVGDTGVRKKNAKRKLYL